VDEETPVDEELAVDVETPVDVETLELGAPAPDNPMKATIATIRHKAVAPRRANLPTAALRFNSAFLQRDKQTALVGRPTYPKKLTNWLSRKCYRALSESHF